MTTKITSRWLLAAALLVIGSAPGLLRAQQPASTPLVIPTGKVTPVNPPPAGSAAAGYSAMPDDITPVLPRDAVFSNQGALFETVDTSQVIYGQALDQGFNPASAIKVATTFAAFRKYGPEYRFPLTVWTNGQIDPATGTVAGDLIVSGRDFSFNYEHAVLLARDLNKQGIRTVTGDLVVSQEFTLNFDANTQRSGEVLYDSLDAKRRPTRVKKSWTKYQTAVGDADASSPNVEVLGAVYVDNVPLNARKVLERRSPRMTDIAKVMLCYSNNFMAEEMGETIGGPAGLDNFLTRELNLQPSDVQLASTSGLGVNRITPRAMMKILRGMRQELARYRMTFADIMPVAGVDPGTLEKRYTLFPSKGSVVGKTGTLPVTDGGASALVGEMNTAQGPVLFVIFNIKGNVRTFRKNQDALVSSIQNMYGGALAFNYRPDGVMQKLLRTETDAALNAEEMEPNQQQRQR
jgi:D-alanyl-D-alanine carboxypeptidase/D-alanyl-D-alanine-endopeptidase (penicillin-binding protein 4)